MVEVGHEIFFATLGWARQRKLNPDLSSSSCLDFESESSPMRLHDLLALVESNAKPARPAGLRRSKQRLKHARGNSHSPYRQP